MKLNKPTHIALYFVLGFVILVVTVLLILVAGGATSGITLEHIMSSHANEGKTTTVFNGRIAYKIPNAMKLNKTYHANMLMTNIVDDSILMTGVKDPSEYKTTDHKVIAADIYQKMYLSSEDSAGFAIIPIDTTVKHLDFNINAKWSWKLIPLKCGHQVLNISTGNLNEPAKQISIWVTK